MAERVREIEALCADVYAAGVELGLPHDLLNRLWVIAGGGIAPQTFALDPKHALRQIEAPAQQSAKPPRACGVAAAQAAPNGAGRRR